MTTDQDPFAAFTEEESGMSLFAKICISIAIAILMAVFYFHGSGKSESYKKPSPSESFTISGLQSKEIATEDVEDYLEFSVGEGVVKEPVVNEEPAEDVAEEIVEKVVDEVEALADKNVAPVVSSEGNSVSEPVKEELPTPPGKTEPVVTEQKQPEVKEIAEIEPVKQEEKNVEMPVIKQKSIADNLPKGEIRQPVAAKGDWKKQLPDFSTLTTAQRLTPLEHLSYDASFNDKDGALSVSGTHGKPLFYYRNPYVPVKGKGPKIAIVMYGLGLNKNSTAYAINSLPANVSLSFSVYSDNLATMVENARKAGHETLLDIPLQAKDYPLTDPGALGLLTDNIADDNRKNLIDILSKNTPVVGFFSAQGESFATSDPAVRFLNDELKTRGLMMVDANKETILRRRKDVEILKSSIVINENMFKEEIIASLVEAKKIALEKGSAVIAIDNRPLSTYLVRDFIANDLAGPDVELVPVTYLLD